MLKTNNKNINLSQTVKKSRRWLILTAIFLLLILISAGLVWGWEQSYAQKIYPGVKIGSVDVGGKTPDQAIAELKNVEAQLNQQGFSFAGSGKEVNISPVVISPADPDLAQPLISFDWPQTVTAAFHIGRQGNFLRQLAEQLQALAGADKLPVVYYLDQDALSGVLKDNLASLEKPPVNAALTLVDSQPQVSSEQSGYTFDYQNAIIQLRQNINNLSFGKINLTLSFTEPAIKQADAAAAMNNLTNILAVDSVKLTAASSTWTLKKADFETWLELQKSGDQTLLGFNKEKTLAYLQEIAKTFDQPAQDAKMQMKDGKITEFQTAADGQILDLEVSYEVLNSLVLAGKLHDAELVIKIEKGKPAPIDQKVSDLGIKELLGEGKSNFAGSPKNRRINIAVGAKSLNGILIAPGEEFSLIKALGEIDGAHGYLQELVIKGDRTVPEYGGGLCQIGTTTFRAALNSGLPIVERRNHSYRVVYYEPAGMDATIYDPKPDLRFLNDTGNYILFMTKISGDNLIFDFYGTRDGRQIEISPNPPSIYNITSPGEPHYIETTDLKPGEKKKIESAHKGADTHFKYTVTYLNGEVKATDFNSHYVSWPEVWLVGAQPVDVTTEGSPVDSSSSSTSPLAPASATP